MLSHALSRRRALRLMAAAPVVLLAGAAGIVGQGAPSNASAAPLDINVLNHGAVGDGVTLDTAAIQGAIDAAAGQGARARVLLPGGHRYLSGTLVLKSGIDFVLERGAELLASTRPEDYGPGQALLVADNADGLRLLGQGTIQGRSREFMTRYDAAGEWWVPAKFRPRLAVFTGCRDLVVKDVTFEKAPNWTLHLVGCVRVLVDAVKIHNELDVPNCDGIDPDHCREVEIRDCHVTCGDDAIVVKATRAHAHFGGSSNIWVHDCVLETQDSGVKVGTETTRDIHHVVFERIQIRSSCRACTIQLRDEGDVHDVVFRDIRFEARYHSDPWWGRGESISFTALPRAPGAKLGRIHGILVENVTGRAENSARISGCAQSRVSDVRFRAVDLTLDRWTRYPGAVWDNRPTTAAPGLEAHPTPAIHVRCADRVELRDCRVRWGNQPPESFTHALEAQDVTALTFPGFQGDSAHPGTVAAIAV